MRLVPLTRGLFAKVDDADYPDVAQFTWHAFVGHGGLIYARRTISRPGVRVPGSEAMHRRILAAPKGIGVDHVNHDTLDNRRANLRLATQAQNVRNSRKRSDNRSGFKGVSWSTKYSKWRAAIVVSGRHLHLGYFHILHEAAARYEEAATEFFGEWRHIP